MSILGTVWLLATEEGGFGLNFNIFETNLINLSILIAVLVYFGRSFLGKILSERQSQIEAAIKEAEQRQQAAKAALAEQQQKLAQAQTTATKIKADAETFAQSAREQILAQAAKDLEKLRDEADRDLTSQRDRVVAELRQRVSALAVAKAENHFRSRMDDSLQQQLVDQSIALLGGRS